MVLQVAHLAAKIGGGVSLPLPSGADLSAMQDQLETMAAALESIDAVKGLIDSTFYRAAQPPPPPGGSQRRGGAGLSLVWGGQE